MGPQTVIRSVVAAGLLFFMGGVVGSYLKKREVNGSVPIAAVPVVSAPQVEPGPYNDRECLARNLAFETAPHSHTRTGIGAHLARQEMEAIYRVMLRRKKLGKRGHYADTLCGVVYQKSQFSWTLKRPPDAKPEAPGRWEFFLQVADQLLAGKFEHPWPAEYECIENYKRTDNRGVDVGPLVWFTKHRVPVVHFEDHTFSCPKQAESAGKKPQSKVITAAR